MLTKKQKIILLYEEENNMRAISKAVDTSQGYVRHVLWHYTHMPATERRKMLRAAKAEKVTIESFKKVVEDSKPEPPKKDTWGFRTPYTAQRSQTRFTPSRY